MSVSDLCTHMNACRLYSRPHFRALRAYRTIVLLWSNIADGLSSFSFVTLSQPCWSLSVLVWT